MTAITRDLVERGNITVWEKPLNSCVLVTFCRFAVGTIVTMETITANGYCVTRVWSAAAVATALL